MRTQIWSRARMKERLSLSSVDLLFLLSAGYARDPPCRRESGVPSDSMFWWRHDQAPNQKHGIEDTPRDLHVTHLTYSALDSKIWSIFHQSQIRKTAYAVGSFRDCPTPRVLRRGFRLALPPGFCPRPLAQPSAGSRRLVHASLYQRSFPLTQLAQVVRQTARIIPFPKT